MKKLGIDLGTSTVKLALLDGAALQTWCATHHGRVLETLREGLGSLGLSGPVAVCVTGANRNAALALCSDLDQIEEIPAIVSGVRQLVPDAGSVIEIGSQSARFITDLKGKAPRFSINEHCAGGTGSFFEDQMSRLGLAIEDYSDLVAQAREIPNLSGRCAVFAKTDIIHRQQEGVPKQDILLGLCYAMIRNYKATIVKNLPVEKPVAFCGGVTQNIGVIQAIRRYFHLQPEELIVPEHARFAAALGAAEQAERSLSAEALLTALSQPEPQSAAGGNLPKLVLADGTDLSEPACTKIMPEAGAYLGIDIGSTSTDLVLMGADGALIDFQYLRTAGDPEGAVRRGLNAIQETYGSLPVRGVGVTGSGRERMGRMMGADAIRDEITAQARAATHWVPEADTVFEIGGQDSKYISLKNGQVAEFQMNKICAAGTGSFVEEQAARMGIPLAEFGPLALRGGQPCDLGERCTVFIETSIAQAEARGCSQADIAAGLCHAIVKNYLHKVVGGKPVGEKIVLQGGVDYNPGIVAAFQSAYGERVRVSPVFSISGAFGAALLAKEAVGTGTSTFLGFDFSSQEKQHTVTSEEISRNKAFYRKAGQLAVEDYDGRIDPHKKTVGVPLTLVMFKFFPLVNAFFKNLGYNVILSRPTNEETIQLSQQYAQGETCYPVKLIYGHMMQLAEQKVDYIFLPSIHTIRHPHSHAVHNYACPYMQMAAKAVFDNLGLAERGIQLLSPILDLDLGAKMMALAMLDVGKSLGFPKIRCLPGLAKGALAVKKYTEGVEALGREMLTSLRPEDKVLVIITRNYGISDPVLNMGIPEMLLQRGYKVMTLGHLPGMSLDISKDYPHMYWPFGDHVLSGAKLIAHHPNLYAVYLTNHGCGPDTLISHIFREEMGEKPYLQIEVDEHYSKVGVVTRIEAFLNSISHRPPVELPQGFQILDVAMHPTNIQERPDKTRTLYLPDLGTYSPYLAEYFTRQGIQTAVMPPFCRETLELGRAEMNSKEYLPLPMLVGACLQTIQQHGGDESLQFFLPYGYGADADGQYARVVRAILDRKGFTHCGIVAPILEEASEKAQDPELLLRAILTGDLVYQFSLAQREKIAPDHILSPSELVELAGRIPKRTGRVLAAVGTPLCLTSLDEGILSSLEEAGNAVRRMPLSEMLWFLWKDNGKPANRTLLDEVSKAMGGSSVFSQNPDRLFTVAQEHLDGFAGANGRYRYAKTMEMGEHAAAVLSLAPRYENTETVLSLRGLLEHCPAPLFELSLDGDWEEADWSRLRSFLYYC